MTETILFFVFLGILLYVGSVLLLGRRSDDGLTREWAGPAADPGAALDDSQKDGIRKHLRTLRVDIEPLMFMAAIGLLAMLVFFLFLELFPDAVLLAVIAAVAIIVFSFSLVRDLALWRARRFERQLVDAIDLLQAALQSGENPRVSLQTVAEASEGQVKAEFDELVKRLALGMPVEQATAHMVDLYNSEGVRLFTQVLIAKWNAGGDLLTLLSSVNRIIRDRLKLRLRISGQLSGARYALFFVAFLPYLVIPVFLWKEPGWLETLTAHPLGPTFLLSAVLLQVAGFFWMRRILRTSQ